MSSKIEKRWYVVNCTVPEAEVAATFRERLAMYAPDEEVGAHSLQRWLNLQFESKRFIVIVQLTFADQGVKL